MTSQSDGSEPRHADEGVRTGAHVVPSDGPFSRDPALDQVRLKLALEATELGIWDWDVTTNEMTWTERAKAIYGFPPGLPVSFADVRNATHPEDLPRTAAMARRALDPQIRAKEPYEFRITRPDGALRWIAASGEAVFVETTGVERAVRYTGTVQDITARKQAEEELRLHALLMERMTEGVSLSRADGTIVYTNPAEDRMFGYGPGELIGEHVTVQNAYPPEENARRVAEVIAQLEAERRWEGEWRNRRKDGSEFATASRIIAIDIGGAPHWLCVQRDVSDAYQAEASRRDSEARLRLAIDAARLAVWELDAATDTITASPELKRILGFPPDQDVSTADIRSRYYPGDQERLRAAGMAAVERGDRYVQAEFRYIWPGGELRWLLLRAELMPNASGQLSRALGVLIDITDQKRTEEALRESEERLELAVRAHRVGIFDWQMNANSLVWSGQQERLFGLEPGSFEGTIEAWERLVVPADLHKLKSSIAAALARREDTLDLEFRTLRADGVVRHLEGSARALYQPDGTPERIVGVNVDVTDRKNAEEHQRILINELNHRVKNTLAIVQAVAVQTLRDATALPDARENFVARLGALAEAHDVLTRGNWAGAQMREVVAAAIRPHLGADAGRIRSAGPAVQLAPQSAVALAMVLHELCTNATKYGALSDQDGFVDLAWDVGERDEAPVLTIVWREENGPPVGKPTRRGFGSRLIERGWATHADTSVSLEFRPDGLICTMISRHDGSGPASPEREW